jgi:hypothetical protein
MDFLPKSLPSFPSARLAECLVSVMDFAEPAPSKPRPSQEKQTRLFSSKVSSVLKYAEACAEQRDRVDNLKRKKKRPAENSTGLFKT